MSNKFISRPFHFSVDDVFDSLIEVSDYNIPLFDHPNFSLFKKLYDNYGFTIDLYLFFQKKVNGVLRTLSDMRDIKAELIAGGDFIRFGPHALDYERIPYNQKPDELISILSDIYAEIDRFAGENNRSKELRLHFYSEMYELSDYFTDCGVQLLLSTDREIGSYRMPQQNANELLTMGTTVYENVRFVRTQFRLEFFLQKNVSMEELGKHYTDMYARRGYVVCYTHEHELAKPEICKLLETSAYIVANWQLTK